jgi:hypothetical protein
MAAYSKQVLTGSTDGEFISVVATATPGTVIHTADANALDELWLWAVNLHSADVEISLEWGGTSSPSDIMEFTVPKADGLYLLTPGLILTNSKVVRAFAGTTAVVNVIGYVNRIT